MQSTEESQELQESQESQEPQKRGHTAGRRAGRGDMTAELAEGKILPLIVRLSVTAVVAQLITFYIISSTECMSRSGRRVSSAKNLPICKPSMRRWLTSIEMPSVSRPPSSVYLPQAMCGTESSRAPGAERSRSLVGACRLVSVKPGRDRPCTPVLDAERAAISPRGLQNIGACDTISKNTARAF